MSDLSPKTEELRQAMQDGIDLEGITADAIAQSIVEVLEIDREMIACMFKIAHELGTRDGDRAEMYIPHQIGLALSNLLELSEWTP